MNIVNSMLYFSPRPCLPIFPDLFIIVQNLLLIKSKTQIISNKYTA